MTMIGQDLPRSAARALASVAAGASSAKSLKPDDINLLERRDLVRRTPDDRVIMTEAGRAHLARADAVRNGVGIDPFQAQHLQMEQRSIQINGGRELVTSNAAESPLVWLARRKGRDGRPLIEPVQVQAGERLRLDFTRAQLGPRVTLNWDTAGTNNRSPSSGGLTITETALSARQRVAQALNAVGPEFSGLLLDVCCFLKGLEDVERERGWPMRSGKIVLQLGLDRLARHYGYRSQARGRAHQAIKAWLAEDAAARV